MIDRAPTKLNASVMLSPMTTITTEISMHRMMSVSVKDCCGVLV